MADGAVVLVLAELDDGALTSSTKELLSAGRTLADGSDQKLAVGIVGNDLESPARDAIAHGADQALLVSDASLTEYVAEFTLAALTHICRETAPSIVLIARTDQGRELAPRLATRLGVGLAQDCLQVVLDPDSKRMVATRPVYGGNAQAAVICAGTPQMASVRPKVYEPLEADATRSGEITNLDFTPDPSLARVKVVERMKEEVQGVPLETARVVVAGGRGLGGPDPFGHLAQIADLLGAAQGASRAAVDAGWVPSSWQIGLTGKTIAPDVYITVGISGASQHLAGCSGAKNIIAINKDAEANIFKQARYGVVGHWEKVVPTFIEALQGLMKGDS